MHKIFEKEIIGSVHYFPVLDLNVFERNERLPYCHPYEFANSSGRGDFERTNYAQNHGEGINRFDKLIQVPKNTHHTQIWPI